MSNFARFPLREDTGLTSKSTGYGALNVTDSDTVGKAGKSDLKDLVSRLKSKSQESAVKKVTSSDIPFNTKEFPLPTPHSSKDRYPTYNSESQAKSAARDEFRRLCSSESAYRPMLKKVFVEYKVKYLKPFYTFDGSKDSAYYPYVKDMTDFLAAIYTEAKILYGDRFSLPEKWKEFDVSLSSNENYAVESLPRFDELSTSSEIIAALKNIVSNLDAYVDYLDFDYDEEYDGEGMFGKSKYKKKYYFTGINSAIKDFIKDLAWAVDLQSSDICEDAVNDVNYIINGKWVADEPMALGSTTITEDTTFYSDGIGNGYFALVFEMIDYAGNSYYSAECSFRVREGKIERLPEGIVPVTTVQPPGTFNGYYVSREIFRHEAWNEDIPYYTITLDYDDYVALANSLGLPNGQAGDQTENAGYTIQVYAEGFDLEDYVGMFKVYFNGVFQAADNIFHRRDIVCVVSEIYEVW